MNRFEKLTLVLGVLLLAALTILPWHSDGPEPTPGGASGTTAIQAPGAGFGIAAAVITAATVAGLAGAVLVSGSKVPHPGAALLPLTAVVLALVVLKFLSEPDDLAVGAWISLLLAVDLVAVQVMARKLRPATEP